MNSKIAFFAAMALFASTSAHATLNEYDLQDDAANMKFVSSEQTQVVVNEKYVDDGWTNDGPSGHIEYTMAPGLSVTVSYHAKDAFTDNSGDSSWSSDDGEYTVEIAGAKKFVSAQIVTKTVTKSVIDEDKSVWCEMSNEGGQVDPSCVDQIVTKTFQAPGKVLQIVTE